MYSIAALQYHKSYKTYKLHITRLFKCNYVTRYIKYANLHTIIMDKQEISIVNQFIRKFLFRHGYFIILIWVDDVIYLFANATPCLITIKLQFKNKIKKKYRAVLSFTIIYAFHLLIWLILPSVYPLNFINHIETDLLSHVIYLK